jgi:hypothetical protein
MGAQRDAQSMGCRQSAAGGVQSTHMLSAALGYRLFMPTDFNLPL